MKKGIFLLFGLLGLSVIGQENTIQKAIETGSFDGLEAPTQPKETEFYTPVPPRVNPYGKNGVPSDAVVLFNGTHVDNWELVNGGGKVPWLVDIKEKSMTVSRGKEMKNSSIQTKQKFGSVQLHLEWKSPEKIEGKGQGRGNSGVFLQGRYEVQILDNIDNKTYSNGQVASVYKQSAPLAMASVPVGQWNSYDIIYHAPVFNAEGEKTKSASITVLHNSVLVQDHFIIKGTTEYIGWPKNKSHGKAPIKLQDHGNPISFRNIWVRNLD
ncbi:DUF1080 domain-containing protein [Tamlana agarivorans]|uniref:DUF1080 domain-containing protein n=1 Tax=Pseudotamlana agarivorans TaxID=481183 RepID=A0ACC5U900_9FLAO|nr:DUF1080 domain-containing protein [Tamlana agarivorans]MBU2950802.1 DUF1080 domain-containing protein [Tamlana agarivorans]